MARYGFRISKYSTMVLDIPKIAIDSELNRQAIADGFEPRPHLHITLVGRTVAERINNPELLAEAIKGLESGPYHIDNKLYHIVQPKVIDGVQYPRESLIVLVKAPWVDGFTNTVSERLGIDLPIHYVHVTIYTKGDSDIARQGIGIDSEQEFVKYCQGVYTNKWQKEVNG